MEKLSIAKVLKPQGLKGELKCLPFAEQSDVFSNLTYVYLNDQKLNVISSVYRLGYVYIKLENVDTIEHADKFRNAVFYVDKEQFDTPLLFWDQRKELVYSDSLIVIRQEKQVIKGRGFESNQDFTRYTIRKTEGIFPVEE